MSLKYISSDPSRFKQWHQVDKENLPDINKKYKAWKAPVKMNRRISRQIERSKSVLSNTGKDIRRRRSTYAEDLRMGIKNQLMERKATMEKERRQSQSNKLFAKLAMMNDPATQKQIQRKQSELRLKSRMFYHQNFQNPLNQKYSDKKTIMETLMSQEEDSEDVSKYLQDVKEDGPHPKGFDLQMKFEYFFGKNKFCHIKDILQNNLGGNDDSKVKGGNQLIDREIWRRKKCQYNCGFCDKEHITTFRLPKRQDSSRFLSYLGQKFLPQSKKDFQKKHKNLFVKNKNEGELILLLHNKFLINRKRKSSYYKNLPKRYRTPGSRLKMKMTHV